MDPAVSRQYPVIPNAEEKFRLFADCIEDYAFILLDRRGVITGWNKGAERLTGYTEPEALGQSAAIIFTPEDRQKGEDQHEIATALRDGRAADERWHVKKNGERFWASGVLTPLHEAGILIGFAKVMRDLTDRRSADEALRLSEERFRLFVDNVRDCALFQMDTEARICGWNPGAERLFGYSEEEILGRPVAMLFSPDDTEDAEMYDETRTLAEGHMEGERWLIRKDATRFFARWVTSPMYDDAGRLRGFGTVLQDETRRKRLEEDRRRLEQKRRRIMAEEVDATKHELRALAANLMTAQEDERRRIARELHDDLAQRLAAFEFELNEIRMQLTSNLVDVVNARLADLQDRTAALSENVRNLSHRLHPSVLEDLGLEPAMRDLAAEFGRTHGLAIKFTGGDFAEPAPMLVATALYRIAQEALHNAAKYARGALITVSLRSTAQEASLTISDDGPGFDPEMVRARGSLGLVSMQERARLAGGSLVITSAPGVGTTIAATVPYVERSAG